MTSQYPKETSRTTLERDPSRRIPSAADRNLTTLEKYAPSQAEPFSKEYAFINARSFRTKHSGYFFCGTNCHPVDDGTVLISSSQTRSWRVKHVLPQSDPALGHVFRQHATRWFTNCSCFNTDTPHTSHVNFNTGFAGT